LKISFFVFFISSRRHVFFGGVDPLGNTYKNPDIRGVDPLIWILEGGFWGVDLLILA
jgi:hypothetical protein